MVENRNDDPCQYLKPVNGNTMIGNSIPKWNPRHGMNGHAAWNEAIRDAAVIGGYRPLLDGDGPPTVEEVISRYAGDDLTVEQLAQEYVDCLADYNALNTEWYFIVEEARVVAWADHLLEP